MRSLITALVLCFAFAQGAFAQGMSLVDRVVAVVERAGLARRVARLRPLIVRAGAVINGDADTGDPPAPQAIVDTPDVQPVVAAHNAQ